MRWVLNIATGYLKFLLNMVVVFFLTPFIVSRIGIELFGLWALVFGIISLFGLLDFGFATAGVKYVAETFGSGDTARRDRILGTLMVLYTGIGVVCIGVVALTAQYAAHGFDLQPAQRQDFIRLVWLLGLTVAANFPASLYRAVVTGAGRLDLVNGVALLMVLTQAALTVILLERGWGLTGLGIASAVSMLGQSLLLAPFAYRLVPGLSLSPAGFSRDQVRELTSFSLYAFLANVAVLIILRIDPIVIKLFLPLSAVALYAIASRVAEYVYLLNKQFSNALMPLVSQSHGRGDRETIARVLSDGSRFLLGVAVPFMTLLWFYTPEIIHIWMGPDFAASAGLLRILLVAVAFSTLQLNAANVLGMTGHHRLVAGAMVGSALLNLLLSLALILPLGLSGVAVATLIAALVVEALVIVPRACRSQSLPLAGFLRKGVWPALPPAIPMLAVAWLLYRWQPPEGLGMVTLHGLAAATIYVLLFYRFAMAASERRQIVDRLSGLRGRRPASP